MKSMLANTSRTRPTAVTGRTARVKNPSRRRITPAMLGSDIKARMLREVDIS